MRTPDGKECKYYYADYYRGKSTEECRLLLANPASAGWKPALCQNCPVPSILIANRCPNLHVSARVGSSALGLLQRVQVHADCREYGVEVAQPKVGCGKCHLHVDR